MHQGKVLAEGRAAEIQGIQGQGRLSRQRWNIACLRSRTSSSYYGNSPVLQGVSVRAGKGEFIAVLGRNGVGKTTLLKTVMGLTDRVTGRIFLDRREITKTPTHEGPA